MFYKTMEISNKGVVWAECENYGWVALLFSSIKIFFMFLWLTLMMVTILRWWDDGIDDH